MTNKNLTDGTIDYGNIKYITQADADKINERSAVDDNDILFAMIGSIGNPVLVKKDREFYYKNMALFQKIREHQRRHELYVLFFQLCTVCFERGNNGWRSIFYFVDKI